MPTPTTPIPHGLASTPIAVGARGAGGIGPKRLQRPHFDAPFVGVRVVDRPEDVHGLVDAYRAKMAPGEFFSHATAAVLHDMWLPLGLERRMRLDVSVRPPARAPRDDRVQGHHLIDRPGLVQRSGGLALANPTEVWCQLATQLDGVDLIVAGESLLAKTRVDARARLEALAEALQFERPRLKRLRGVFPALRMGSRSPWETRLRLLLVDGGLREPEINAFVRDDVGEIVSENDLVYRLERVLVEYEGDQHRSDLRIWRNDIRRYELLQDLGWRVVRVTADDIVLRPIETVARVRRALAR